MFNSESLINIFNEYHSVAIFISLIISIIIAILGLIPSVFVTGANIIFFGPLSGFFISLLGEVVGGYVSFVIYRKGLSKFVNKITPKYSIINRLVNSKGYYAGMLILQGRLIPFIPSGIVTLAAAVSGVNGFIFTIATLVGKIPSISLEVLVSYQIINIEERKIDLMVTLLVIFLFYFTYKNKDKWKEKTKKRRN